LREGSLPDRDEQIKNNFTLNAEVAEYCEYAAFIRHSEHQNIHKTTKDSDKPIAVLARFIKAGDGSTHASKCLRQPSMRGARQQDLHCCSSLSILR
jgi:hypothetical protein